MPAPTCWSWRRYKEKQRITTRPEYEQLFGIEKLHVPCSKLPADTYVDFSARVQTVHCETNPRFHALISAFDDLTGCPVLVNTSFNVRGEPIVNTPEQAYRCFMRTEMDVLAIENCLLEKSEQPAFADQADARADFPPD